MAKKTRSIASSQRPASWIVQGREYKIGKVIRVITPELSVIDAQIASRSYDFGGNSVRLSLGWIKTPRPCISTKNGFDAMRTYSVIGIGEGQLHLVYVCNCRRNVHSDELRWRTNLIDGVIRSNAIGQNDHTAHNHPLTDGYKHLLPIPQPLLIPPPIDVKPGTQFSFPLKVYGNHPIKFTAPNDFPSSCNGTLYRDMQLVIVSETGEGMSVTNACATIATELVRLFKLNPVKMLLIDRIADASLSSRSMAPLW